MRKIAAAIALILALMASIFADTGVSARTSSRKKSATAAASRPRKNQPQKAETAKSLREKKQLNQRQIRQTAKQIEENKLKVETQLKSLNRLDSEIKGLGNRRDTLERKVGSLRANIAMLTDSIGRLDSKKAVMSAKYGSALRRISTRNRFAGSDLAFLFSARSVGEAWRRQRSLVRFSKWRARKAQQIDSVAALCRSARAQLDSLRRDEDASLASLKTSLVQLDDKRRESDQLLTTLRRESKTLNQVMKQKQQEAQALEAELQRIIALEAERARREEEERRRKQQAAKEARRRQQQASPKDETKSDVATKEHAQPPLPSKPKPQGKHSPAEPSATVGATFASSKGRLRWPVNQGLVVKPFGRHKHPDLPYVETDNPGVDIETSAGAHVVAVYDGRVSDIFRLPGYQNIVMVRHGHYITIYANLATIAVKKGDDLKAGQLIGSLAAEPDNPGRSILHFEIRNEKNKENPELWLQ